MHPFYGPSSQLLADGNAWWLGLVSMAMYLLFWAAVIVLAVILFKRYFLPGNRLFKGADKALDILRERYARGEIDADEFKRIKADLEEK
jgi:putative membrane protein